MLSVIPSQQKVEDTFHTLRDCDNQSDFLRHMQLCQKENVLDIEKMFLQMKLHKVHLYSSSIYSIKRCVQSFDGMSR